jgi:hypothetical protein
MADEGKEDNRDAAYREGTPSESGMSSGPSEPSETSARGERQDAEERKRTTETLPIEEAHRLVWHEF